MDVKVRKVFRSGNLIGIPVKTPDLKRIGEIEEVVISIESGKVAYAVLCFGGHFGFGEKFFAVPWKEFRLIHDEDESYFVVDTTREKLKLLQGFDKEDWPDVAKSNWDRHLKVHDPESDGGDFDDGDFKEIERRDKEE